MKLEFRDAGTLFSSDFGWVEWSESNDRGAEYQHFYRQSRGSWKDYESRKIMDSW